MDTKKHKIPGFILSKDIAWPGQGHGNMNTNCPICGHHRTSNKHKASRFRCANAAKVLYGK